MRDDVLAFKPLDLRDFRIAELDRGHGWPNAVAAAGDAVDGVLGARLDSGETPGTEAAIDEDGDVLRGVGAAESGSLCEPEYENANDGRENDEGPSHPTRDTSETCY